MTIQPQKYAIAELHPVSVLDQQSRLDLRSPETHTRPTLDVHSSTKQWYFIYMVGIGGAGALGEERSLFVIETELRESMQ